MAKSSDETRLITAFVPSLQHRVSVRIAVPLYTEFGLQALEGAFDEIRRKDWTAGETGGAKEILLHIPAHLRETVMEAVHGLHHAFSRWSWYYQTRPKRRDLHWKGDGSFDGAQTVRNLAHDAELNIKCRFLLACEYCVEESVRALWAEMEASGEAESLIIHSSEDICKFWATRMREQRRDPWTQSLGAWMRRTNGAEGVPRLSAFFPLLRPEERRPLFRSLNRIPNDDLLSCLHAFTKEEEERLLKSGLAFKLLSEHLEWPLQASFVQTAEKLWDYININGYRELLMAFSSLLENSSSWKYFDYSSLLKRFWKATPLRFRELVKDPTRHL